jgi:hypothetical protein
MPYIYTITDLNFIISNIFYFYGMLTIKCSTQKLLFFLFHDFLVLSDSFTIAQRYGSTPPNYNGLT